MTVRRVVVMRPRVPSDTGMSMRRVRSALPLRSRPARQGRAGPPSDSESSPCLLSSGRLMALTKSSCAAATGRVTASNSSARPWLLM
jgi:hypothetical protein